MKTKQFEARIKALGADGGEPGTFSAVVAVFDNVDRVGDRLKAQAFDNTLKAWRESGNPIPVVFAHVWDDPNMHIGYADPNDVKAVPGRGLVVEKAYLDIEDNPVARQVHRLMERGTLTEFSFGYSVAPGGEKKSSDGAYDLTEVNLFEFGPCLKGVNPETELLEVKAAVHERATAGRAEFKSYVDVDIAGSLEERLDAVRSAVRDLHPSPPGEPWVGVAIVATTEDAVTYQVCSDAEEAMYSAPYSMDAEGVVTLGDETPVELTVTAAKAEAPAEAEDVAEVKADAETDAEADIEVKADEDVDTSDVLARTNLFLAQERLKMYEAFAGLNEPGYIDAATQAESFRRKLEDLA